MNLQVSDMFFSIQGEGIFSGSPTIFIRTSGCSVGCHFCDEKKSWSPKKQVNENDFAMELGNLVSTYGRIPSLRFSITGGEPLEYPDNLIIILTYLGRYKLPISIETSGAFPPITWLNSYPQYTYILSPKLSSLPDFDKWYGVITIPDKVSFKVVLKDYTSFQPFLVFLQHFKYTYLDEPRKIFVQPEYSSTNTFDEKAFNSAVVSLWLEGWNLVPTLQMHKHLKLK